MDDQNTINERQKKLNAVYKKSFRRGRSEPAYAFDLGFVFVIAALALYICIRPRFSSSPAAWFVTGICLAVFAVVLKAAESELFLRHVKKLREQKRRDAARAKLIAESGCAFGSAPKEVGKYYSPSIEALTADEVLRALKSSPAPVTIVSAAEPTKRARELIASLAGAVRLETAEPFHCSRPLPAVSEEEIDEALLYEYSAQKKPAVKELLGIARERPFKYFCTAAGLFALSFIVRYALYYRLMACAAAGIGSAVLFFDRIKKGADRAAPK